MLCPDRAFNERISRGVVFGSVVLCYVFKRHSFGLPHRNNFHRLDTRPHENFAPFGRASNYASRKYVTLRYEAKHCCLRFHGVLPRDRLFHSITEPMKSGADLTLSRVQVGAVVKTVSTWWVRLPLSDFCTAFSLISWWVSSLWSRLWSLNNPWAVKAQRVRCGLRDVTWLKVQAQWGLSYLAPFAKGHETFNLGTTV